MTDGTGRRTGGRVKWVVGLAAAAAIGGFGCRPSPAVETALSALGITDAPAKTPIALRIGCDVSAGAPCTAERLEAVLDQALPHIAARPGSVIELWIPGDRYAQIGLLCAKTCLPSDSKSRRAARETERRFVADAKHCFLEQFRSLASTREHELERSLIAELVAKMALAGRESGLPAVLLLITDGAEVSDLGNFERLSLPTEAVFLDRLARGAVLPPKSLAGTAVIFSDFDRVTADGGGHRSRERHLAIESLWHAAFAEAGASTVRFFPNAPDLSTVIP